MKILIYLFSLCWPLLAVAGQFSGDRAMALLEELCALGPRVPGTPEAQAAGDWIVSELESLGLTVQVQRFTASVSPKHPLAIRDTSLVSRGLPLRNIIARIDGMRSDRIVLGAHWDSRPFADEEDTKEKRAMPVLGANDAASGVVVLLELARLLAEEPPVETAELVFFDGEDWGRAGHLDEYFLGSLEYARRLEAPLPVSGVLLDMVGETDLKLPFEAISWQQNQSLCRRIWTLAGELGYGHIFQWRMGPAVQDDHTSLIRFGVPMIDIIDFDFPEWHTLRDTPEICSPASLEAVGRVMHKLLMEGI
jgi:glutaminyl-peptide cyclotransferase